MAEDHWQDEKNASRDPSVARKASATDAMLHDLQLHQIELEMQNEELRRVQSERDTADARYFDFYDLAPVGYVSVSAQGRILHGNLTAASLLGVARNELAGQVFSRFVARAEQDSWYLMRHKLMEQCSPQACELQMVKQDGGPFIARMDAIAARGEDGAWVLRLVLIDISRSKEASMQRHAMDQAILNSVNAEVVVLDQDGVIRLVNEPWRRFASDSLLAPGLPSASVGVGANYLAAGRPDGDDPRDNAGTAHDGIRAVLAGALPSFSMEYTCHTPDRQRWFSMRALPLSQNPRDGITITHTDITAHHQAEVDLRIAAVAFESQEAVAVMDSQRQVLRVNQAFTDITGYSKQEMMGKTTRMLRSKRHPAAFFEAIWHKTVDEGRERGGRWLRHKSGQDFYAYGSTTAVKDHLGVTTHFVISFADQTLTQRHKQRRAEEDAVQREALVREVHHRIKNNLQGIGGLLLQFGSQKPEIAEQMQLVAGHLYGVSVIHGLQGRNGQSPVRLCELTREIAQATSVLWSTEITVSLPAHWTFRVVAEKEAVALALVLNELLVNAVKHGGKLAGHVWVTLSQASSKEGVLMRIVNAGYLNRNGDLPATQHHGLQLVESLRPRDGLALSLEQHGDQVHTLLQLEAPVITLDAEN